MRSYIYDCAQHMLRTRTGEIVATFSLKVSASEAQAIVDRLNEQPEPAAAAPAGKAAA